MPSKKRELRIAAGTPERHSRVWKVVATGSQVYLAVRGSGNLFKVSLHSARGDQPAVGQFSITKEFTTANPAAGLPKETRHLARWNRPQPDECGQTLGVRLYLPFAGMRGNPLPAKPVTWIGNPGESQAVDIRFMYCPESMAVTALSEWGPEWSLVCDWPLPNGERFRAFAGVRDHTPEEDEQLRQAIAYSAVNTGIELRTFTGQNCTL